MAGDNWNAATRNWLNEERDVFRALSDIAILLLVTIISVGCGGRERRESNMPDFPDTSDPAAAMDELYGDIDRASEEGSQVPREVSTDDDKQDDL